MERSSSESGTVIQAEDSSTAEDDDSADATPWKRIWSVLGTLAANFGTFGFFAIQGILLARMLGPEGRGEFATVVAYPQMLLFLGLCGAAEIYARRAGALSPGADDAELRRSALRYGAVTGLVTGLVCAALAWFLLPAEKQYLAPLATLAALSVPLQHVRFAIQGVDHGRGFFNRYNAVRIIAAAAFPLILFTLWISDAVSLQLAAVMYVVAFAFSALFCQWGMSGSWFGCSRPSLRTAVTEGRGLAVSQVVTELLERADLILILYLGSFAEQGFYASAVPIAGTMIIVPNAVGLYSFLRGTGEQPPLSARMVTRLLMSVTACQVVSGAILAGIIPVAVPLLYGKAFQSTVIFAWWLLPAAALRGLLMATDGYLRGRGRPRPGVIGRLVALCVLLVVTFSAQPTFGVLSIPIALVAAQAVALVFVLTAMYGEADREE